MIYSYKQLGSIEPMHNFKNYYLIITGVSYKWFASVAGLPNFYLVIDG